MKITDKRAIKALQDGKKLRSEILHPGWGLCLDRYGDVAVADDEAICPMRIDLKVLTAKDWRVLK